MPLDPTPLDDDLRREIVTTIRLLAADMVQAANSGHPGAPMGQADLALVLWHEHLRFDPDAPGWAARDRFVLSCGHASALIYSLLHLWGYDLPLGELERFRQWGSITPGHPEVHETPGIETPTGPLGQGVANSVGMALAAKMLDARTAVDGDAFRPMTQRVFAVCSDGDLMEGVSAEAASLAGHWGLDNLVWLYDDNKITIDGDIGIAFSEDVAQRFAALGWRVERANGHDHNAIRAALKAAEGETRRPTIIICRTHIGWGSPNKVDTAGVHGSPLGDTELAATKANLGWPDRTPFHVPGPVRDWFTASKNRKRREHANWESALNGWRGRNPEAADVYDALWTAGTPDDLVERLVAALPEKSDATRKLSAAVLQAAYAAVPALVGGSADLTGSNGVALKGAGLLGDPRREGPVPFGYDGRQMHFGIREHAMGSLTNGMVLHGGVRPFSGTFLVFSDYCRPAIRLAALSHIPNIFVFTHDSIFLGEDGPTHQPVEHMWALRVIPGVVDFRPADGLEVALAWAYALEQANGPVAMALTRQGVPTIERPKSFAPRDVWKGGYAVVEHADPEVVLVGTGSELHLCVEAGEALTAIGRRVRVVSMPSVNLFEAQDAAYRDAILPPGVRVVTVEAGITGPWAGYTGRDGLRIGLDRFGASAPAAVLAEKFGLTGKAVAARIISLLDA